MVIERKNNILIFYDGECALCNWSIQFIIKRDRNNKFAFISQNSHEAKKLFLASNIENNNSVILFFDGKIYTKSSAILFALDKLGGFWKVFLILKIFPKTFRDLIYDVIARNRNKWFGTSNYCRLPDQISNF
jgi:predicted DCC family thiol-disulfide oxidoreductase YuxK